MLSWKSSLAALLCFALVACGGQQTSTGPDEIPADAASVEQIPPDSGTPSIPADASTTIPADASTTIPADASTTIPPDASTTIPPDAGSIPADAGGIDPDAGSVPPDAGTIPADAGSIAPDAATVNAPPAFDPIAPITMDENTTQTFTLSAVDPDGDQLTFDVDSNRPAFVTMAGATVTLKPGFGDSGSYTVGFTVHDGKGGQDKANLSLTVANVNRAPVLGTLSPVTMSEGGSVTVTLTATDPDGDQVTFALGSGAPAWASLNGSTLTLAPGFADSGTFSIDVQVKDANGLGDTGKLSVTVKDTNRAPVISAINPITLDEGTTKSLTVDATDADGDAVAFKLASGSPSWASIVGSTLTLTPGFSDSGTGTFVVQASDGKDQSTTTVSFTVNDVNRPPTMNTLVAVVMNEGETKTVTVSANDADGDPLTFSLGTGAPTWATLNGAVLTLAPGFSDSGSFSLPVKVSDGRGGADANTLSITVNDVNRAPVFGALNAVTLDEGTSQTVKLTATDADGDTVTFALGSGAPAWASLSTDTITLAPGFSDSGTVSIPVEAIDSKSAKTTGSFSVTVKNVNRAPSLSAVADVSMAELETKTVTLVGSDPDGDTVTYSLGSGAPSWATINGATVTLAPKTGDAGTVSLSAIASDGTLSDTKTFSVKVAVTNTAPTLSNANQFDASNNALAAGASMTVPPTLKGTIADAQGDNVRLEAEVVLSSASFIGTPTHTGTLAPAGAASLSLGSLPVGTYKWQIRAADAQGLASQFLVFNSGNAAFTIQPQSLNGSIAVANGAGATKTATVNVNMSVTPSNGATLTTMQFSNDGTNFSAAETYGSVKVGWTLDSTTDGTKTVTARVKDSNGNTGTFVDTIILDTTPPSGTFSINGGATSTNSTAVTLSVNVSDATSGMKDFSFSNDNVTFTPVTVAAGKASWTLATGDGAKTVFGRFTDNAGNVFNFSQSITLDTAKPTASVSINAGAAYTKSANVTLTVGASDANGVKQVCYSNDGVTFSGCGAPVASQPWSLTAGDGAKKVTIQVTDNAGNVTVASANIILDGTAPTVALKVGNGSGFANTNPVTLTITPSDATSGPDQMQFSNDGGQTFSTLENVAPIKSWNLTAGDGAKTVSVRITDKAGNASNIVTVNVFLDTVAPTGTVLVKGTEATDTFTNSTTVTLNLTSSDPGTAASGVATMEFSNDGVTWSSPPDSVASTKTWTLTTGDGTKKVSVRFTDKAGNTFLATDGIVLDATAPTATLSLNNGATATNQSTVSLAYVITENGSGLKAKEGSNDGTTWTALGASPVTWTLVAGDGTKKVSLRATDVAGNVTVISQTIILDTVTPKLTAFSLNSGAAYSNTTALTAGSTATDNSAGVAQICLSTTNPPPVPSSCVAYNASVPFNTSTPDGAKTVYAMVLDAAGNASAVLSDSIILDTTPPTLSAISINSGAAYTNVATVSVTVTASDANGVNGVAISTDGGATWGSYQTPSGGTVSYTLAAPDGQKTLTVKVRDAAGNESVAPYASDSIILDTTPPTGTVVINGNATYATSSTVTLTLSASDTNSVTKMCVKNVSTPPTGAADACFVGYAGSQTWTLSAGDGTQSVYVWFLDSAGLVSASPATDSIIVDTVPPTTPSAVQTLAGNRTLLISWTGSTDATSGLASYQVGLSTTMGGPYTYGALLLTTSVTLTLPNEQIRYIVVRARDKAGNYSALSTETSDMPAYPFHFQNRAPSSSNMNAVLRTSATAGIFLGDSGLALHTADAGATLVRIDPMVDVNLNAVARDVGGYYNAVGAAGAILISTDAGLSWNASTNTSAAPQADLFGLTSAGTVGTVRRVIAVGDSGTILKGTRDASQVVASFAPVTSGTTSRLYAAAQCGDTVNCDAVVIAAGDAGTMLRSTDRGDTWKAVTLPAGYGALSFRAVIGVAGSQTMYAAGVLGAPAAGVTPLIKSTDAGATWTTVPGFTGYNLRALSAPSATQIWVGGSKTLLFNGRYLDSGAALFKWDGVTTAPVTASLPATATGDIIEGISAFDVSNMSYVADNGTIVTTKDGLTFADNTTGSKVTFNHLDSVNGNSANSWVVGNSGTILSTTNSGGTWTQQASGTTNGLFGVSMLSTTSGFAVGSAGTILRYTGTWAVDANSGTLTGALNAVSCATGTGSQCFAVGADSAILRYQSATGTWTTMSVSAGADTLTAVATVASGTGYRAVAVGVNGAVKLINTAVAPPISSVTITGNTAMYGVAMTTTGIAIAAGVGGKIFKSTDFGATWAAVTSPVTTGLTDVTYSNGYWFVSGSGGVILKSSDNGVTWKQLQTDTAADLKGVRDALSAPNKVWGVGVGGTIIYSDTYGE